MRVPPRASEKATSVKARNSFSPALSVACMSITRRVCGVTSANVPRVQCSTPAGERMQTSNGPPASMRTLAAETVYFSGLNQRITCSAVPQALNSVSRGAWKTREIRSGGGCREVAPWFASSAWFIAVSFAFKGFQVVAQPVEAVFPFGPPGVDPLFRQAERSRLDGAGPYPAEFQPVPGVVARVREFVPPAIPASGRLHATTSTAVGIRYLYGPVDIPGSPVSPALLGLAVSVEQRQQFRPLVQNRQHHVRLRGRQRDHHPNDTEIAVTLQRIGILGRAEQ